MRPCLGTKEGLWACRSRCNTDGDDHFSFTRSLSRVLNERKSDDLNVARLHLAMYECFRQKRVKAEPGYNLLSDVRAPSSDLYPLKPRQMSTQGISTLYA